jgi:thiamine-monophosphate kinase
MDLSDGLSLDLYRLCVASKVAADLRTVPVSRGATIEQALHGGEDYELLFTLPPHKRPPKGSIQVGTIAGGPPGRIKLAGVPLAPRGYRHFA